MKGDATTPFELLQEIDRQCRQGARGLPTGAKVEEDWVGIGFMLGGKRLVAKMSDVAEIISPPKTIRVPGVREWVQGLANVRGTLLPILDMTLYLQQQFNGPEEQSRVLVINKQNVIAGLKVQEVFGLRRFKNDSRTTEVAEAMGTMQPYLDGAFNEGALQWNVFSIEKLVSHEPFLKVV